MNPTTTSHLISLLELIDNSEVETYTNFPDRIKAGKNWLEKEDLDYLCDEGYLEVKKIDSFGKFLQLSERARALLKNRE